MGSRHSPRARTVVTFDGYRNAAALKGKVAKNQGCTVIVAGKPDLEELVAAATAKVAAEVARIAEEAKTLKPSGFVHIVGCDTSDSNYCLWPKDSSEAAQAAVKVEYPSSLVEKYLKHEDFAAVKEQFGAEDIDAGMMSYGGDRFGAAATERLFALARERRASIEAAKNEKQRVRDEAEAARWAKYDDMECVIVNRYTTRGEEKDPGTLVEVRSKTTSEKLRFNCRNIFDFGYTVNPAYSVVPGQKAGGIAMKDESGAWYWNLYDAEGRP